MDWTVSKTNTETRDNTNCRSGNCKYLYNYLSAKATHWIALPGWSRGRGSVHGCGTQPENSMTSMQPQTWSLLWLTQWRLKLVSSTSCFIARRLTARFATMRRHLRRPTQFNTVQLLQHLSPLSSSQPAPSTVNNWTVLQLWHCGMWQTATEVVAVAAPAPTA